MGDDDARSAEEFCRQVWDRLARSMAYLTGDAGTGEDIAQEALSRAWARWSRVSRLDEPEAWVYRVAVNLARSRHRRRDAERRAFDRAAAATPPPDASMHLAQQGEDVVIDPRCSFSSTLRRSHPL